MATTGNPCSSATRFIRYRLESPQPEHGGRRVKDILRELDIIPETVLVICGDDLVTADQVVREGDTIELRPVMSGGSERVP